MTTSGPPIPDGTPRMMVFRRMIEEDSAKTSNRSVGGLVELFYSSVDDDELKAKLYHDHGGGQYKIVIQHAYQGRWFQIYGNTISIGDST